MRLKSSENILRPVPGTPRPDAWTEGDAPLGTSGEVQSWAQLDPHLVAAVEPGDPFAQSARNLRAMIAAARLEDGHRPKVVVLLGADADPETALLSANVAIASAQSGWRTLLIDSNGANAVQHALFGVTPRYDLEHSVDGEEPTLTVRASPVSGLALGANERASSKLAPMQMHSALRQFVDDFDLIVVDASHASGSSAATFGADAAVVVLRRDFTAVADTQELVHSLRTAGTAVLGTFMFR